MNPRIPTFSDVFERLQTYGPACVVSIRGTTYRVTAEIVIGTKTIVGRPRSGAVRVHEDCWGERLTCQGTRAGGLFRGSPSIFDWYWQQVIPPEKEKPRPAKGAKHDGAN